MNFLVQLQKAYTVTISKVYARKYTHLRFFRLENRSRRNNYCNLIKDYSKLNTTYLVTKITNYIFENEIIFLGESCNLCK